MAGEVSPDLFEEESDNEEDEEWVEGEREYANCLCPAEKAPSEGQVREETNSSGRLSLPAAVAPLSRIGLNDNKAGMEGLDKARINQIILEASRGSKYYENERRKEKRVQERVQGMLGALERVSHAEREAALAAADRELEELEGTRDLGHIIVHVDMDAFYASVEMRDNPRLRDVPMAVGGNSMLSTSNYLARRYGVRAAMPGFIARKLCPNLVIVPLHFEKYREASRKVREILVLYDPHFCPVGLDEAYLDLTDFVSSEIDKEQKKRQKDDTQNTEELAVSVKCRERLLTPQHWECAERVVEQMRSEIKQSTHLTASAGLAPNMTLAKVASDMNKPDGQFTVPATREAVLEFVHKLPIRKISGIGKVTESTLNALGVTTCGDLHRQRALLHLLFSQTSSSHFMRISLGLGLTQEDAVVRGGEGDGAVVRGGEGDGAVVRGGGGDGAVVCPVCGSELGDTSIQSVNAHIDECLSLPIITRITTGTHSPGAPASLSEIESPRKATNTESSSSISPCRPRGREREGNGKEALSGSRKRHTESGDSTTKRHTKRHKTLDQFWN